MDDPRLESLLKLFSFSKKRDLELYSRDLVISGKDFANLVICCDVTAVPFLHQISYRDIAPTHLHPSDSELAALGKNDAGALKPQAAKAVRKVFQMFEERRYLVGHMFFSPDLAEWHFFCFDQRDLEKDRPNHWKKGSHVHFFNWLWPEIDAQSVWSDFVTKNRRPGNAIHVRVRFFL